MSLVGVHHIHYLAMLLAIAAVPATKSLGEDKSPAAAPPRIFARNTEGAKVDVDKHLLTDVELAFRDQFARKDAPDEIIAIAVGRPYQILIPALGEPVGLLAIYVRGEKGELRWYTGGTMERHYHRPVLPDELNAIRAFLAKENVDMLPELTANRRHFADGNIEVIVGGTQHLYLRFNAQHALRIPINNPPHDETDAPPDDQTWQYTKVVDFFRELKDRETLEVRYEFPRAVPGLEVLHAAPDIDVLAVRGQGGELCVTIIKNWVPAAKQQHRVFRDGKLAEEVLAPEPFTGSLDGLKLRPALKSADGTEVSGRHVDCGKPAGERRTGVFPCCAESADTRGG